MQNPDLYQYISEVGITRQGSGVNCVVNDIILLFTPIIEGVSVSYTDYADYASVVAQPAAAARTLTPK